VLLPVWVGTGLLVPLFLSLRGDSQASPEYPPARVLATQAGIVVGLLMVLIVLLVLHDRRRAIRGDATDAEQPSSMLERV
jgi:crotonobetainyl-CoA:carnitine CoA-transferase CaiB-like acyl-CoA transferase